MKCGLRARNVVWTLALTVLSMFQPSNAIGQVSLGSASASQSAGGQQTLQATAEPTLPPCPAQGIPTPQSPPPSGHHKVILSWNASVPSIDSPSIAVGYCLYRSNVEDAATNYATAVSAGEKDVKCVACEQINTVAIAVTACVDPLAEDNKTYYYVATAISAGQKTSRPSNEATVTVLLNEGSPKPASPDSYPLCRATNH